MVFQGIFYSVVVLSNSTFLFLIKLLKLFIILLLGIILRGSWSTRSGTSQLSFLSISQILTNIWRGTAIVAVTVLLSRNHRHQHAAGIRQTGRVHPLFDFLRQCPHLLQHARAKHIVTDFILASLGACDRISR